MTIEPFDPASPWPAESRVLADLAEGAWAELLPRPIDPSQPPDGEKPQIRATFIRHLMLKKPTMMMGGTVEAAFKAPMGVRIVGAQIVGDLELSDAEGGNTYLPPLALEWCDFTGSIKLDYIEIQRLSLKGSRFRELSALHSTVHGPVDLMRVAPIPTANADLEQCWVKFTSASIDGDFIADYAQFRAPPGRSVIPVDDYRRYALALRGSEVKGSIKCNYSSAKGGIDLGDASVDGEIWFRGAQVYAVEGYALRAQSAKFHSILVMDYCDETRQPFVAIGGVWMLSARIDADMQAGGGVFLNPHQAKSNQGDIGQLQFVDAGCAIELGSAVLGGSCRFHNGFVAHGSVNLYGTKIAGDLDFTDGAILNAAVIDGVTQSALFAANAEIGGGCTFAFSDQQTPGFRAAGNIDFRNATIAKQLYVSLDGSKKEETIPVWFMQDVKAGSLSDANGNGWGTNATKIKADRFVYDNLEWQAGEWRRTYWEKLFGRLRGDEKSPWKQRKRWLINHVEDKKDFSPQPYEQLARVFYRLGFNHDAHRVLIRKRWRELFASRDPISFVIGWPFGAFFGFGYGYFMAFVTFVALFLAGASATNYANTHGLMGLNTTPVSSVMESSQGLAVPLSTTAATSRIACGSSINPALYALDVFIPLVDLHQESTCAPADINPPKSPLILFSVTLPKVDIKRNDPKLGKPAAPQVVSLSLPVNNSGFWQIAKSIYALLGVLVTSLVILTFSGVFQQKSDDQ